MDVTCDNCKAEYDFDDTLLGDKGTTVKCSKCGHVFRVMPPRREPARSALKVRFRDGRIESVASLRELQQRIQAGQVGVDDELGRDGFNYRRLGDVPELKNFFTRSAPASGPVPTAAAAAAKNDLPHRGEPLPPKPAPKRTMLGMGGNEIPSAPRVPNFGPVAAQALAPTQPAAALPSSAPSAATPKSTLQGRAPISSAPTAPNMAIPARDTTGARAPISNAPTPTHGVPSASQNAPTKQAAQGYPGAGKARPDAMASTLSAPATEPPATKPAPAGPGAAASTGASGTAPTQIAPANGHTGPAMRPLAGATGGPVAQRPAGPMLRISDSMIEGPARSESPHVSAHGLDSVPPGALKAAAQPQSGAPRSPSGKPVRLSLDDDELPERARGGGGARWLLYLGVAALLGGGGFVVARQLAGAPGAEPAAITPPVASNPVPPTPALELDAAPPAAEAAPAAAAPIPEPAAPVPEQAPSAAAPAPAKPAPSAAPRAAAPSASAEKPSESGAGSAREPKDYAGWVGRGEQLIKKGDLPGAQKAFEAAVALRATGSEANSGLGAALLAQGQTREAIPFLTRAANNGFAEASIGLGDAYRKLGEKDAAIEAYETYLARLPKGARASYVKLQLEGLGRGPARPESRPEPESPAPPRSDYRPAGELNEPSSAPAAESPQ